MTARGELLAIQKAWLAQLKRELHGDLVRERPAIRRYWDEYRHEFNGPFATTSRDELVRAATAADIVYVGDYHTLEAAQRTFAWLAEAVCERRGDVAIALEMLEPDDQPAVDAYLEGSLDEASFLEQVRYRERWGFAWEHYRPIFELARRTGARVYGFDREPERERASLAVRDRFAASVLARVLRAHAKIPLFVLVGDLHLARRHLPARVDARLAALGEPLRRRVLVFQNSEVLYWRLVQLRREHATDVVRLDGERFCVMAATPLAKVKSYIDWARRMGDAERLPQLGARATAVEDEEDDELLDEALLQVAAFFGIDPGAGSGRVRRAGPRVEAILAAIPARAGLLARTPLDRAAELATRRLASKRGVLRGEDAFYGLVLREAFGFVGSCVVNHARAHRTERDFRDFLGRRRRSGSARALLRARTVARVVVKHVDAETRWRATGERPRVTLPARGPVRDAVARALGERLGSLLYRGLIEGRIAKERVRELLVAPLSSKGEAVATYFGLVLELGRVGERLRAGAARDAV